MKTIRITILLMFCITFNGNAQFFKKLAKKAQEKIEKSAEDRAQRRVDEKIDKTFDKAEEKIDGKGEKSTKETNVKTSKMPPSSSYTFSHKFVMQMNDGKKPVDFEYYLINSGDYLGINMPSSKQSTITVMDIQKQMMYMFMENKGEKTRMSFGLNFNKVVEDANKEYGVEINKTSNSKSILGYRCEEYLVEGKDFKGSVWITKEAGITFPKSFYNVKNKKLKGSKAMDQSWVSEMNGLTMEMNMIDTSKRKPKTITMNCISLSKENFSINATQYKKIM